MERGQGVFGRRLWPSTLGAPSFRNLSRHKDPSHHRVLDDSIGRELAVGYERFDGGLCRWRDWEGDQGQGQGQGHGPFFCLFFSFPFPFLFLFLFLFRPHFPSLSARFSARSVGHWWSVRSESEEAAACGAHLDYRRNAQLPGTSPPQSLPTSPPRHEPPPDRRQ